jgi:hypothetical protein
MAKYVNKIQWYDDNETYELEAYYCTVVLWLEYNYKWINLKSIIYEKVSDINLIDIMNNLDDIKWDDINTSDLIEEIKKDIDEDITESRLVRRARRARSTAIFRPMASQPENL